MRLTVALLQLASCHGDQERALCVGEAACREAARHGADLAVFPELWIIGYTGYADAPEEYDEVGAETPAAREARLAWQRQAIARDSAWVRHFASLAASLQMAIAITYLEEWPGAPRNTVTLFDRHGREALTYAKVPTAKVHTCVFGMEAALTPGDSFPVASLDAAAGEVRVGAMICFDREFPEGARLLMLGGAEIIITPNACPLEANRLGQFRARAYENAVAVAMANYAYPSENGHSCAYDPMVVRRDGTSRDTTVVLAGEQEGVILAPFDLAELRDWRSREAMGNAFRRPSRYAAITDPTIAAPFVRPDATGRPYHPDDGAPLRIPSERVPAGSFPGTATD